MSDIWSNIGATIGTGDVAGGRGHWLYRVGPELRGPMPESQVVEKLLRGEIGVTTLVAREGSDDFHPIARVAAFAEHVKAAQRIAAKRSARRRRIVISVAFLLLIAGGALAGLLAFDEYQKGVSELARRQRAAQAEAEKKAKALSGGTQMKLVALVSLGTEEDVKIRQDKRPAKAQRRGGGGARRNSPAAQSGGGGEDEAFVSQCKLSQAEIFGTLRKHIGKLNVCVEDEKSRDSQGLLPDTLTLDFVVQASGTVVDFTIDDRHYRKGPLNNCMTKAFRSISFPSSDGANCPVTIPIKIGG